MKNMELLAPAGAWESMVAAVQNGADAIYLGGRMGNARQFAGNFREDGEMRRALEYCHLREVKVYVTLNTLLLDRELAEVRSYAAFLYEAGADALILQDLGLIRLLREALPGCELHASTQMAVHDVYGLAMCADLGLKRAVLARELSLARIAALAARSPVRLECFAHGAMCTAVSGDCLFSSLAGGRSGNRGACAQPCRKAYAVDGGAAGYPLSLEDLCMLEHLEDLRDAGVACIKLEGRMKRPEYVGVMTRAYRMGLDGAPTEELRREWAAMQKIFSRGGGTGYYYTKQGKGIPTGVAARARGGLAESDPLLKAERARCEGEKRLLPLSAKLVLRPEQPVWLRLCRGEICAEAQGEIVQAASGKADAARVAAQMGKLGGNPFYLESCEVDMPVPAHLPVAAQNALRREAVAALSQKLAGGRGKVTLPALAEAPRETHTKTILLAVVPDESCARAAFAAVDTGEGVMEELWVALEPGDLRKAQPMLESLQDCREAGKLLLQLPAVDLDGSRSPEWERLFSAGLLDGGVAQHASQARVIKGEKIAGYLCNATNIRSVLELQELGFGRVLLSLELNRAQLRDLIPLPGAGIYGYGRAQMMQLWHCPSWRQNGGGCGACGGAAGSLRDEAGRVFPLDRAYAPGGGCLTRLRNCDTMDILDAVGELPRPGLLALEFSGEGAKAVAERMRAAQAALRGGKIARAGSTRGHWARGWEA